MDWSQNKQDFHQKHNTTNNVLKPIELSRLYNKHEVLFCNQISCKTAYEFPKVPIFLYLNYIGFIGTNTP
jgi:hypothetical protein